MPLKEGDIILTAWCESHRGPGWSNQCVRYVVLEACGNLRDGWLQPEQWASDVDLTVYAVSQTVSEGLVKAVKKILAKEAKHDG